MTQPRLAQPGPALQPRVECLAARITPLDFTLEPGLSLLEAVARPLQAAGFASAAVELQGGGFHPFAYVLPAHAADAVHAAWYSATHEPPDGRAAGTRQRHLRPAGRRALAALPRHLAGSRRPPRRASAAGGDDRRRPHRRPRLGPLGRRLRGRAGCGDEFFPVPARADARAGRRQPAPWCCGCGRTRTWSRRWKPPAARTASPAPHSAAASAAWFRRASPRGRGPTTSPPNCWSPAAA